MSINRPNQLPQRSQGEGSRVRGSKGSRIGRAKFSWGSSRGDVDAVRRACVRPRGAASARDTWVAPCPIAVPPRAAYATRPSTRTRYRGDDCTPPDDGDCSPQRCSKESKLLSVGNAPQGRTVPQSGRRGSPHTPRSIDPSLSAIPRDLENPAAPSVPVDARTLEPLNPSAKPVRLPRARLKARAMRRASAWSRWQWLGWPRARRVFRRQSPADAVARASCRRCRARA